MRHWAGGFSLFLHHTIKKNQAKIKKKNCPAGRKCFFESRMKNTQLIMRHLAGGFSLFLHHTIRKNQAKMKTNCPAGRKCFFESRMKSIQLINH